MIAATPAFRLLADLPRKVDAPAQVRPRDLAECHGPPVNRDELSRRIADNAAGKRRFDGGSQQRKGLGHVAGPVAEIFHDQVGTSQERQFPIAGELDVPLLFADQRGIAAPDDRDQCCLPAREIEDRDIE